MPVKKADTAKANKVDNTRKYTRYIKPMLATLVDEPFDGPDWLFEIKWDGYRAVAEWQDKKLKLYSRNGLSFMQKYPLVVSAIMQLKHNCILDGEIVVTDEKGRSRFQLLQEYDQHPELPIRYYIFDLLSLNGEDIRHLPLINRKELLQNLLSKYKGDILQYSDHVEAKGKQFFKHAVKLDMEGIIAKKADSEYEAGTRTRNWLKIKNHNSEEAIIAGYTSPRGSRKYFGALILGNYKRNKLQYIGHTGTGFTFSTLKEMYNQMQQLKQAESPFEEKIKVNAPVTWLRPKLVCEVKFTEKTREGILRHPVFLGLRSDKSAKEVIKNNDK
ncbi:non-homologous end-joining DNA ligase [Pseudoflavitalea sp. G-6-1-2]|uniref:non-homologous end-joining DNA ligase n=1 Tax=Pseudoflavitalea sp. G-6-1-2 TaxID=2728841 RepID=UPI001F0EE1F3|nr:non-homologous end-joining DNA ligase [Pseudoflavitalea sp. G-6-1-2]